MKIHCTKTIDDRIAYYLRKYDRFCNQRMSRKAVRRALRLMRYKAAMLRTVPEAVAV